MAWKKKGRGFRSMDWSKGMRKVEEDPLTKRKRIITSYPSPSIVPHLRPYRFLEVVEGKMEGPFFRPDKGRLYLLLRPLPHKMAEVEQVLKEFFTIPFERGAFNSLKGRSKGIDILIPIYSTEVVVRFSYSVPSKGPWEEQWKAFTALQGKARAWMVWWAQVLHEQLEKP